MGVDETTVLHCESCQGPSPDGLRGVGTEFTLAEVPVRLRSRYSAFNGGHTAQTQSDAAERAPRICQPLEASFNRQPDSRPNMWRLEDYHQP